MMDFDDHMTSEDTKRTNRNNAEKKRRDQFNTLLTELGNILNVMPEATSATAVAAAAAAAEDTASIASRSERGFRSSKMDKTTILKSTIHFLRQQAEKQARAEAAAASASGKEVASGSGGRLASLRKKDNFFPDLKPPFLSIDAFTHLMMEATDGFLMVLNAVDGHIIYASESITSLLGYLPNDLRQMSLYELLNEDEKRHLYKLLDNPPSQFVDGGEGSGGVENVAEIYLHIKRLVKEKRHGTGDEQQFKDENIDSRNKENFRMELVRLSGYFRKWNSYPHPSDDGGGGGDGDQDGLWSSSSRGWNENIVYIATAKLMSAPLVRELPIITSHKAEFKSRFSLEWKFLFLDQRAPPIIGYLPFEVLGTSGYEYYHPDDLKIIADCHKNLMLTGEATSSCYRFLTKGQQWIWLDTRYYISYNQWNSKPEFVVATHRVSNYRDVMNQLRKENNPAPATATSGDAGGDDPRGPLQVVCPAESYPSPTMSPTWSSKSSMCGSSSIASAMTRASQQDSSRLSNYSRSEGLPCSDQIGGGGAGGSGAGTSIGGMSQQAHTIDSRGNTTTGNTTDNEKPLSSRQQQQQPQVSLTPVQISLQQQLLKYHDELAKRIAKQQEELKRLGNELRMVGLLTPAATASSSRSGQFHPAPNDPPSQTPSGLLSYEAFMQDNT